MSKQILLAVSLFAIVGCKDDQSAPKTTAPETTAAEAENPEATPVAAAEVLKLSKMSITTVSKNMVDGKTIDEVMTISMSEKGEVTAEGGDNTTPGEVVGTLFANGEVKDKNNRIFISVAADGTVASPVMGAVTLADDGTMSVNGKAVITIADDGTITIEGESQTATYEGAPDARRTAAVLLLAIMMRSDESVVMDAAKATIKAPPVEPQPTATGGEPAYKVKTPLTQ